MNLDKTLTPAPNVISQEVGGETVLLDLKNENYFGLDAVGTRIWQLIQQSADLRSIFRTLVQEYEVEEAQLQADLERLIGELSERGLVKLQSAEAG